MTEPRPRFSHVHPSLLSLARLARMVRAALGLVPWLRTPSLPRTHAGVGTDPGHWSESCDHYTGATSCRTQPLRLGHRSPSGVSPRSTGASGSPAEPGKEAGDGVRPSSRMPPEFSCCNAGVFSECDPYQSALGIPIKKCVRRSHGLDLMTVRVSAEDGLYLLHCHPPPDPLAFHLYEPLCWGP